MSSYGEGPSRGGHRGRVRRPSSPQEVQPSAAATSSRAVANVASDSSTQFNADVGRRTRTSIRRDIVQVEENNNVQDGRLRAEQGNVQHFYFNYAQNASQMQSQGGDATAPAASRPRAAPGSMAVQLPRWLGEGVSPALPAPHRSASSGDNMSVGQHSPPMVPTPTNAGSSVPVDAMSIDLAEASQRHSAAIQRSIAAISGLYKRLPERLERFTTFRGLSAMRKDLSRQSATFEVNVHPGIGGLISNVADALRKSQGDEVVGGIRDRLDYIHRLLKTVESLLFELAAQQDKLSLPIRQRRDAGKPKHGQSHPQSTKATIAGRVGMARRRPNLETKHKNPDVFLGQLIAVLNEQIDEFLRECQKIPPAQHRAAPKTSPIPEDLELAQRAAVLLCKALCQACPDERHVHSVLLGLATDWPSPGDGNDAGDDAGVVRFNLAFESQDEPETWFVVRSTIKAQGSDETDAPSAREEEEKEDDGHHHHRHHPGLPAAAAPNARFCLQYHKQGAGVLAAALRHSDAWSHELFYPDPARLGFVRGGGGGGVGGAVPLGQLLEDGWRLGRLGALRRVRLARLLAEAVLKFHAADWLFCEWDWDGVLVYEVDGEPEPHLRVELRGPGAAAATVAREGLSRPGMGDVLSRLGTVLGNIAAGQTGGGRPTYEAVRDGLGSSPYAEIFQACVDMSETRTDLGDVGVREDFYTLVVARLEKLEEDIAREEEELGDIVVQYQDQNFI